MGKETKYSNYWEEVSAILKKKKNAIIKILTKLILVKNNNKSKQFH